jgi:Flp pilus assembly protein TadD
MQPVIGPILANGKRRASRSKKAHQLDPKSVVALIALGQISAEMKDFVSARKYYEDALKLEPNGHYAQTAKEALQKLKKK